MLLRDVPRALSRDVARPFALLCLVAGALRCAAGTDVDDASPNRSTALAHALAARGLDVDEASVAWVVDRRGVVNPLAYPARALVRASVHHEPNDLYLVEARLSPEGRLLAVGGNWNLTRSAGADESAPVFHGELAAYDTQVDGAFTAVHVLDLGGWRDARAGELSRVQAWQQELTQLQNTGQMSGVRHDSYALDAPATALTLAFHDDGMLAVTADGHEATIDPNAVTVAAGGDWLRPTADVRARPGNLVTWSVDRVRAMPWFGDDKMQVVKAVAFTALDWVQRTREKLLGDSGAKEVAEDMAGVNGGGTANVPTYEDPEIGWPPAPMETILKTPLPNEGQWIVLDKDPFIGKNPGVPAAFATSFLRTDKARPQSRVYVTMWDPRQVALHMVAGTVEPVSATGEAGPGVIPRAPEVLRHVVGGFNGGFQAIHGEYGMEADGVVYLPPKPYAATILEMRDGSTTLGSWPGSADIPDDVLSYRQNMTALVQMDKFNPWGRTWWGGTPPGWADNIHTTRSGVCLTKENYVGYFYGIDMSAEALAAGMLKARCAYGVHLDMNPGLAGFEFYDVEPAAQFQPLGRPLQTDWEWEGTVRDAPDFKIRARRMIKGMGHVNFPQYIHRDGRDFFYLTARAVLPGQPLPAGPPKEPGEGEWRVKGLPQHGFPYAVAVSEVRPDADHPEVRVLALRVDPRAVRTPDQPNGDAAAGSSGGANAGAANELVATLRAPDPKPNQPTLWLADALFVIGASPPEHADALVSGSATLDQALLLAKRDGFPHAAVGVHDEDGMLEWLELAPGVTADAKSLAVLDATLQKSGCSTRLFLPPTTRVTLGDALDLTLAPVSPTPASSSAVSDAATPPVPERTTRLLRRAAPGAHAMFESTPIVSPNVWQPLQSQRVRYFHKPKPKTADSATPTSSGAPSPAPDPTAAP